MDRQDAKPTRLVRALHPLRDFLATEAAGGVLLVLGAGAALLWANSPWASAYHDLFSAKLGFSFDSRTFELDLRHWVNEGLMTIFFFVVGLEIKRELAHGHLATRQARVLPVAAAFGGMAVPALIYIAIAGTVAPRGWGVPMATDIALAVGVLAVAGDRIPPSMRAFLLAFAIVDDVGAIVIIAAFYSTDLAWTWLGAALAAFVATALIRRIGAKQTSFYVALGVIAWFGLHEGGVHATLAGVVMGLLAPTIPHIPPELVDREDLADISSPEAVKVTTKLARGSVSVVEWLQNVLHPWTSYVIVPIFAFANIGIEISADSLRAAARSPITWGIVTGLVAGKPIGILLARHLVGRFQPGDRTRASRRQVLGVGTAAGIGFSVALFISELAFADPDNQAEAKLAILLASLIAAAISLLLLVDRRRRA